MNREQCRRLQNVQPDTNLGDLPSKFMLNLRDDLDSNPETCNWRAFLIKAADEPRYRFSAADVERKFGNHVYTGSPSDKMLWELGSLGMTAAELVYILDKLKLEKVLIDIKKYEPIVIKRQPTDFKSVIEGEILELEVTAIGFPYPRYQWFKASGNDWDMLDKERNNVLRIINVRISDAGVYCCRLHNGDINSQVVFSDNSTVDVELRKVQNQWKDTHVDQPSRYYLLPSFEVQPTNSTVKMGDGFRLDCTVLSKYPVIYDWYKNHDIIKRSDQSFYEVKCAYKEHTGTYDCRARNQFGEAMSDIINVTVVCGDANDISEDVPVINAVGSTEIEIISNPKTVIIEFGGDCLFSCEARCSRPIVYQWLKDGVPMEGEIKPDLVLKKIQNYDHQGLYNCMMSIPGTESIRLSFPASLSIKSNDKPEFNPSDKVALLIGNFDYRCESPLSAPKSDVYTMAEIFRSLDFKVVSLLNLTKTEMLSAVEEFVKLIGSEVYAVFYFCGHGFEEEAKCYLVPPDARHGYTMEDCVCAEDVLNQMQNYKEPALIVLILDICRIRNQSPPQLRDQELMTPPGLNNFRVRGNTVLYYATSKGMYAYEDMHNGILVKYLKKYLPKQMSVVDVFTSVQEDIGKESQYYNIQIPEFKSNLLQPRRSLSDRISTKGHTQAYNKRTVLWNNAHEKPKSKEVEIPKLDAKVLLEFQTEFSNMLTIFCTVTSMTGKSLKDHLGCIGQLPKTISIYGSVNQVHDDPPKTKIVLQDLQKLTNPLEVQVFVVNLKTKVKYDGPKLYLGKPLVGILDLWKPRRQPTECSDSMK